jgi:hypothetical protein
MRIYALVLAGILSSGTSSSALAAARGVSEFGEREMISKAAQHAFFAEDFEALESTSKQYRCSRAEHRAASGSLPCSTQASTRPLVFRAMRQFATGATVVNRVEHLIKSYFEFGRKSAACVLSFSGMWIRRLAWLLPTTEDFPEPFALRHSSERLGGRGNVSSRVQPIGVRPR